MADLNEIQAWMELKPEGLEAALATEYGITQGIDVAGAHDSDDRTSLLGRAITLMRRRIEDAISASHDRLEELACRKLRYCERRETAIEVIVVGIIDAGVIELILIPLPLAGICVYIVKHKMLDPICGCRERIG